MSWSRVNVKAMLNATSGIVQSLFKRLPTINGTDLMTSLVKFISKIALVGLGLYLLAWLEHSNTPHLTIGFSLHFCKNQDGKECVRDGGGQGLKGRLPEENHSPVSREPIRIDFGGTNSAEFKDRYLSNIEVQLREDSLDESYFRLTCVVNGIGGGFIDEGTTQTFCPLKDDDESVKKPKETENSKITSRSNQYVSNFTLKLKGPSSNRYNVFYLCNKPAYHIKAPNKHGLGGKYQLNSEVESEIRRNGEECLSESAPIRSVEVWVTPIDISEWLTKRLPEAIWRFLS